ncbi:MULTISPECIES: DUF6445 family protein [unclassified Sphingomonas]|uniref:DUF6445 family protein n=1 Tax=unclassified Sphingomonas TaxID=196159 RepID=UPI00226A7D96|nr:MULTISPECIES: DUF6445 family protein [unclassified Sphingomonas]
MVQATQHAIGTGGHGVLVLDGVDESIPAVVETAAALAPFPPARGVAYPGLRRTITPGDRDAVAYAQRTLRTVVPAINAAFGLNGFDLLDASFSLVTAPPDSLIPMQRSPHFDSVDPDYLALLHYVGGTEGSGTGFYRQRATGIERVSASNVAQFVARAAQDAEAAQGYVAGSNAWFEQIGFVEAVPNRLVVYRGSLLHSGIIPADMRFSTNPRDGRLTANFFVRGRPAR